MAGFCHQLIRKVSKEMASEIYETMASEDAFYKAHPSRQLFVDKQWNRFVSQARAALGTMLGDPNIPESQKEIIYEALLDDRSLPRGGRAVSTVN